MLQLYDEADDTSIFLENASTGDLLVRDSIISIIEDRIPKV
jgi:hypothetical protein